MEYAIALLLAIIGIFLNHRLTSGQRTVYFSILLIYVILVLGFRYQVGSDTISYMMNFKTARAFSDLSYKYFHENKFEPGYLIVCAVCRSFTKEFWPVQMIMATITNLGIFLFIKRNTENCFIGIALYLIFLCLYFSTEVMRESAAIGIFLLNYKNLQDKRWIWYYLFCGLSILFHFSAIITLFFPLVRFIRLNYTFYIIVLVVICSAPLVEQFNSILSFSAINDKIDYYSKTAADSNLNWKIAEIIKCGFPAVGVLVINHYLKISTQFKSILLLQILLCAGTFAIPVIFSRFINYTFLFVIVSITTTIIHLSRRKILRTLFICFLLTTQVINYHNLYRCWFPYVSIFNPYTVRERMQIVKRSW